MIRILSKMGTEGMHLNLRVIYDKPMAHFTQEILAFPLRSETRQRGPLSSLLFNIVLEILARSVMQEKEIKDI